MKFSIVFFSLVILLFVVPSTMETAFGQGMQESELQTPGPSNVVSDCEDIPCDPGLWTAEVIQDILENGGTLRDFASLNRIALETAIVNAYGISGFKLSGHVIGPDIPRLEGSILVGDDNGYLDLASLSSGATVSIEDSIIILKGEEVPPVGSFYLTGVLDFEYGGEALSSNGAGYLRFVGDGSIEILKGSAVTMHGVTIRSRGTRIYPGGGAPFGPDDDDVTILNVAEKIIIANANPSPVLIPAGVGETSGGEAKGVSLTFEPGNPFISVDKPVTIAADESIILLHSMEDHPFLGGTGLKSPLVAITGSEFLVLNGIKQLGTEIFRIKNTEGSGRFNEFTDVKQTISRDSGPGGLSTPMLVIFEDDPYTELFMFDDSNKLNSIQVPSPNVEHVFPFAKRNVRECRSQSLFCMHLGFIPEGVETDIIY